MSKNSRIKTVSMIMIITLIGKMLGLVREVLIGAAFGTQMEGVAFNIASTFPRDFLDIAFASAVSGCFIPVFNSYLEDKGKAEAYKLANIFLTIVIICTTVLTLVCMAFSGTIASLMGPELPQETKLLTSQLLKITLPLFILSGAAFSLVGILQSMGEFNVPAAMTIISNIIIIIYCIFFADLYGVYGLAAVFLLGWLSQLVIQIPSLKKFGFKLKPSFNFKHPGLKEIGILMLPVMVSTWVQPVNNLINISLCSYVNQNATVAYSKANVLYSVIAGVFVLSIANVLLPALSKMSSRDDNEGFGEALSTAIRSLIFFLIPMTAGLFVLSKPLCSVIYMWGEFDEYSVSLTSTALSYFSLGMLGFGLQTILSRAFYAQKNGYIPLLTGVVAVLLNYILSNILKDYLGVGGPALSSAISFTVIAVIMLIFMYRRNKSILNMRILIDFLIVTAAALVMGAAVYFIYSNTAVLMGAGRVSEIISIGLSILCGVLLYMVIAYLAGIKEALLTFDICRKFILRRK